jgi:hypothetical protein
VKEQWSVSSSSVFSANRLLPSSSANGRSGRAI